MPINLPIVLSILIGLQCIVFGVIIYTMHKQNQQLLSYIMSDKNVGAYMATKTPMEMATPKEVQDKTTEQDYNEYTKILNSGVATDDQEKRFGHREPVIQ